jgi:hypothetical protein
MNASRASFEFHRALETPAGFLRREWKIVAITSGVFVIGLLAVLLSIDTAFFYPRIETDQLRYLLKAKAFVETGTTDAREAVNGRIFIYAAMPGLLRAPFLFLFQEFDNQLRAIQVMNVLIAAAAAVMSAYILSWALPQRAHKWAVVFAFTFVLLSPDWVTNILVPLPDAPYAALTQACVIIAAMIFSKPPPLASRKAWLLLFALLLAVAFFVRYTALVLLVYAGLLLAQRWSGRKIPVRTVSVAVAIAFVLAIALLAVSAPNLVGRYFWDVRHWLVETKKLPVALHLAASALPAQIVPVFNLGFEVPPLTDRVSPVFGSTPRDIAWTVAGLLLSLTILRGMIAERRRLLPEIWYLLLPLPLLALLTPSTTRYLMTYQPFIWIFFATGLAILTQPLRRRGSARKLQIASARAIACAAAAVIGMRSATTARTSGSGSRFAVLAGARSYTGDVSRTFRGLRNYLERLPRDETLLVEARGNVGRFKVIAGQEYYMPDSALFDIAGSKRVYSVLACGSAVHCADFKYWIAAQHRWIDRLGSFDYRTVYETSSPSAQALVEQIIPRPYSASGLTAR